MKDIPCQICPTPTGSSIIFVVIFSFGLPQLLISKMSVNHTESWVKYMVTSYKCMHPTFLSNMVGCSDGMTNSHK